MDTDDQGLMYIKSGIVAPIIYFFDSQVRHIDQDRGGFDECGCCVGAWLARHFHIEDRTGNDFINGFARLANELDLDRSILMLLLTACGATPNPDGSQPWPNYPAQVFRALRYFEKQTDPNSTQCTIQWEIDRARR